MDRRDFLRISALWATASALSASSGEAQLKGNTGAKGARFDAVVIGSGLGGLSCAAYMAKHGMKVLVLEQHDVVGGYATTFTRDHGRFTFDVSLHQTALTGATEAILKELGVLQKVEFLKGAELFRLVGNKLDITCPNADPKGFADLLVQRYPLQKDGINGFMAEMLGVGEEVERLHAGGALTWFRKATFPLNYPKLWAARKKSLGDYLDKYVTDPELKSVLSVFCGYHGLPPSRLSGFYYLVATGGYFRAGGSYPRGGSQAISNAIARFIESKGGEIRTRTKVERVLVNDGKIAGVGIGADVIDARTVVANCSAARLFNGMIPPEQVPEDFREKLRGLKPSISSFNVWLGLNQDITGQLKNSHLFLVEEPDPEKSFQYCLEGREDKVPFSVAVYNNIYKDYSPPGTTVLSITFSCGYDPWAQFETDYFAGRKHEYHARKERIAQTLIKRVEEKLIPGLSQMIAVQDAATPLTNVRYTLNERGAIYGYEQIPENSFMYRLSNRTPIKDLYLASAWGEPGGGYTGVLLSGKSTFGKVVEDAQ
ncbi:MAG: NAD(P)/FAD-dependent oxidoreductase [Thermodesulfobacteriota bacterium]